MLAVFLKWVADHIELLESMEIEIDHVCAQDAHTGYVDFSSASCIGRVRFETEALSLHAALHGDNGPVVYTKQLALQQLTPEYFDTLLVFFHTMEAGTTAA